MPVRPLHLAVATTFWLAVTAVGAAPVAVTPRSPAEQEHFARDVFAELVAIDTTHAKGSAKAAEALRARFLAAGFAPADIWVGGERADKMNIVVRLRGKGKGRPVLFNAHLDVVEATRDTWATDPFQLVEKDGFFYGRGTIDVKDEVAIITANLIRLKKEGFKPDRDIIAFFNVDEEAGGDMPGVDWMIKEHRPLIDAELVINQDAANPQALKGVRLWNQIQTSEKIYATYSLTATGDGGHSSLPGRYNAIGRLAAAVAKLDAHVFPVHFTPTTRAFLASASERVDPAAGAALKALLQDPGNAAAGDALRDVPVLNSQLRSTCPATVITGGQSESALPMKAVATIQCRLLPDENTDEVLATIKRVIADPKVEVGIVFPPDPSPTVEPSKALMSKVEQVTREMWPGLGVVPFMSSGASDNVFFRLGGLTAFGVSGTFTEVTDQRAHGRDERVGVDAFYESLEFDCRLMKSLSAAK